MVDSQKSGLELCDRIRRVADLYADRKAAAAAAGVSPNQLGRYLKGDSEPGFAALAGLAAGQGVSLEWVAGGLGSMRLADREQKFDGNRLAEIIEEVETFLESHDLHLIAEKKALLVVSIYDYMSGDEDKRRVDVGVVERMVRLAS